MAGDAECVSEDQHSLKETIRSEAVGMIAFSVVIAGPIVGFAIVFYVLFTQGFEAMLSTASFLLLVAMGLVLLSYPVLEYWGDENGA